MALTGFQIQKLLPKTNCAECGSKTCMAFAMKLAARKAEIADCPYASEEAKQVLGAAYERPVRTVALGADRQLTLGDETVLYRHEKTFVNQTLLGVAIDDDDTPERIRATLESIASYSVERVGETIDLDVVGVVNKRATPEAFAELARDAWQATGKPLVIRSENPDSLRLAAQQLQGSHSVLASATAETVAPLCQVAKEQGHVLALRADTLDQLIALVETSKEIGFSDVILELSTTSLAEGFQTRSIARRMAIANSYKPLGYSFLRFVGDYGLAETTAEAVGEICKYGGICVLPRFDLAQLLTLTTLRLNIFTDPQKPIQVEPRVYPIGEPTPESPVFLTTNFSLTYFLVSAEIENTGISAWLVVPECEGMSVLTAWAAGKFTGGSIAKFCKEVQLDQQVTRREMIIPGCVASISGDLEENMPGWAVIVGPQEASDLESFIKARLSQ